MEIKIAPDYEEIIISDIGIGIEVEGNKHCNVEDREDPSDGD